MESGKEIFDAFKKLANQLEQLREKLADAIEIINETGIVSEYVPRRKLVVRKDEPVKFDGIVPTKFPSKRIVEKYSPPQAKKENSYNGISHVERKLTVPVDFSKFGPFIKTQVEIAGSQSKLARHIGICSSNISNFINNKRGSSSISIAMLRLMHEKLGKLDGVDMNALR